MTTPKRRLVVVIDADLLDPEWTDKELIENAACYLSTIVSRAERENRGEFPDQQSYKLDSDVTVYVEDDYVKDLVEWGEALNRGTEA